MSPRLPLLARFPASGVTRSQQAELTTGTPHNIICELQPFKSFTNTYAVNRLASLKLAGNTPAVHIDSGLAYPDYASSSSARSDNGAADSISYVDRMAKYRLPPDEYLGMGRVRLSLVKLGCWTNMDVPLAVSQLPAAIPG